MGEGLSTFQITAIFTTLLANGGPIHLECLSINCDDLSEVDPELLAMAVCRLKDVNLYSTSLSSVQVTTILTTLLSNEEHQLEFLLLHQLPGGVDPGLVAAVKEKVNLVCHF